MSYLQEFQRLTHGAYLSEAKTSQKPPAIRHMANSALGLHQWKGENPAACANKKDGEKNTSDPHKVTCPKCHNEMHRIKSNPKAHWTEKSALSGWSHPSKPKEP